MRSMAVLPARIKYKIKPEKVKISIKLFSIIHSHKNFSVRINVKV